VFFITGGIGFVWAWVWLRLYQPPAQNKFLTDEERSYLSKSMATSPAEGAVGHFLVALIQLPSGLGLDGGEVPDRLRVVLLYFLAAKISGRCPGVEHQRDWLFRLDPLCGFCGGKFIGGWFSGFLMRRQWGLESSRKLALTLSALLMPVSLFIAHSPLNFAIVFFSLAMFAHQFWSANVQTLPADLFPSRVVGLGGRFARVCRLFRRDVV
jgi:ACS family hexuronate transporter-like MFS transporter